MEKSIKILADSLSRQYNDLERTYAKVLRHIDSYTFVYGKIENYVELRDYNGVEYIVNGFYHDKYGNIILNVVNQETDEEKTLNDWNYDNIVVYKNMLDTINSAEFPEEDEEDLNF